MSGLPNLTNPLLKLTDPLGLMPKEVDRTVADPLGLVTKPAQPTTPSQQQLYGLVQSQQAAKRAAAINESNTTNASLSRPSMGASYLGG
ncbi:hypothetical protein [Trinickia soli]|uniref:Uncharacterized protein n=1 Tax=Trinickia soli TaxID=380675 RepID=A0A2N7VQ58_9BURK|nr:hypothetical protein [Trinickia soli]PMS19262.1 hypothetical protein C0Z19_21770 [Trinickia soli]CAB3644103.1 hypothetical protein LMG24076_00457 [Trinickia soli]